MKTITVILAMALLPLTAICQGNQKSAKKDTNFKVATQQVPYYPAGDKDLYMYFYKNIKYSREAIDKKISGNVMFSFDVLPDSTIANVIVLSSIGYGLEEQILKFLAPLKYAPGIQNGEKMKMNVILTVPVRAE